MILIFSVVIFALIGGLLFHWMVMSDFEVSELHTDWESRRIYVLNLPWKRVIGLLVILGVGWAFYLSLEDNTSSTIERLPSVPIQKVEEPEVLPKPMQETPFEYHKFKRSLEKDLE